MDCWNKEEIMRANGRYKVIGRIEKGELTMKEGAVEGLYKAAHVLKRKARHRKRFEAPMAGMLMLGVGHLLTWNGGVSNAATAGVTGIVVTIFRHHP